MKCEECKYYYEPERTCYYMGENRCVDNEEQTEDAISREETIHGSTYGGVSWGGTYKPQQSSEDAISRQAAIEAVKFGITYAAMIDRETGEAKELFCESNHELKKAIDRICELPSVTPKQRIGRWICTIEDWNKWTCSECGYYTRTDIHVYLGYDYCPKCGCQMVGEQST